MAGELYKPYKGSGAGLSRNALDPHRCHIGVWSNERWATYNQCSRKGLYDAIIDGTPAKVCAIHRPDAIAKREADRRAREAKRTAIWNRQHARPQEYKKALREIAAGHNDARLLAREVLDKWGDFGPD